MTLRERAIEEIKNVLEIPEEEIIIKGGYPMIAPFEYYDIDDIEDMEECDIEKLKEGCSEDKYLILRNLDNPTKGKVVISTCDSVVCEDEDEFEESSFNFDIEGLESCFVEI